ncbi:DUF3990 domain-containing protein [uncultured Bacteroides sp.]|uniref:DUF3990 domain-containing protein n=1 Tax=uncultured Bacteroides sp. TaxID=162156 RepID=UPI0025F7522A|nr:DUF3990 domain-containing protein [uncultured Bacteroides sp.]
MKLYHSSNVIVESPDTLHSRNYLDFGRGFYLTSLYEQAVRYAQRFKRRGQHAWLNTYEFSFDDDSQWKILKFDSYDENWLDFVAQCRDGKDVGDYDMVVGGIANDRVILTLDRYFAHEISQEEALGLLRFEKPNIQYCIRTERMLRESLTYINSEQV